MSWRAPAAVVVLAVAAAACVSSGSDELSAVGSDEPADVAAPGPPPDCGTIVASADLLASPSASIDETRNQLPVMHELYQDTVLVWDEFGIQPDHTMVNGWPRMLLQPDDVAGRCEDILGAVARPDLVRFVEWTEEDYSNMLDRGGLPPWRQLIEISVGNFAYPPDRGDPATAVSCRTESPN